MAHDLALAINHRLGVDATVVDVRRRPKGRHVPYIDIHLPSGATVLVGAGVNAPAIEIATSWQPPAEPLLARGRLVDDPLGTAELYDEIRGVATVRCWHLQELLPNDTDLWAAVIGHIADAVVSVGRIYPSAVAA
jgi:hypothetical protein